jgi:phytoene synthase
MTITLQPSSWEHQLLQKASLHVDAGPAFTGRFDEHNLSYAYQEARSLTRFHSKTFYMTSGLLSGDKKQAARALYAFCRVSDDIVDANNDPFDVKQNKLREWAQISLGQPSTVYPVTLAWADTRIRYGIPKKYAEQLLEGMHMDLMPYKYQSFEDLAYYCYLVASTVGLMSMHIYGYESEEAIPYAIKLGVALQLTNILRDVGEDYKNGRVYLPQDELAAFGLSNDDIGRKTVDVRWIAFMKFQIERVRNLYKEALPGIGLLSSQGRFAIAASAVLYRGILNKIEANGYDVFNHRAHLTNSEKLQLLPGIWWQTKGQRWGLL